jgi:hypothetical protein
MNQGLESLVAQFRSEYALTLKNLMTMLDEAHISHYSPGCDERHVTFQIFPASGYVAEMLRMVSLERDHKPKNSSGLRDAERRFDYNPAVDFIHYLRRWSIFAEQVMRAEGPKPRGVAAARALLIMQGLVEALSEGKTSAQLRMTTFAKLMAEISATLETREKENREYSRTAQSQQDQANYHAAMRAASAGFAPKRQLANIAG